jgi:NAD(P)-dependent dehydrogenase (short-subunit alcohol dehydrogenase family)
VITGLEQDWGSDVMNELGTERAVLHIADISDDATPQILVDLAIKTFGRLDAIVNNAAIVASSNLHTTGKEFLRRLLEVNTVAPFALVKAALPHLEKQHGCVLNIGSVNAYSGEPNLFAYSVSKGR